MSKSVKTPYGMGEASTQEALRGDFAATRRLTDALETVERIHHRIGGLPNAGVVARLALADRHSLKAPLGLCKFDAWTWWSPGTSSCAAP